MGLERLAGLRGGEGRGHCGDSVCGSLKEVNETDFAGGG